MSSAFYIKWWVVTRHQLAELQKYDAFMRANTKPVKDRVRAGFLVADLYCKYCAAVQDVAECLDQIRQAQKSSTIRKLMDATVIRLDELKEMLMEIDLSEVHYVDGALIELKLVPYSIEVLDLAFLHPRPEDIQEMWETIQTGPKEPPPPQAENESDLLLRPKERETLEAPEAEEETGKKAKRKAKRPLTKFAPEKKELTQEEVEASQRKEKTSDALKLIQTHERARQCRLYVSDLAAVKKASGSKTRQDSDVQESAAAVVQRTWRGASARNRLKFQEGKRRLLIGMTEPSWKSDEEFVKRKATVEARRKHAREKAREFARALTDERNRVLRVVAPGLMEDVGDEIREWFRQWYLRAKNFDKYPPADKGGSVLIVRAETFTPEEWLDEVERQRREKIKGGGKDKAKEKADQKKKEMEAKKKEAEKRKREAEAKRQKEKNQEFEFQFRETPGDARLTQAFEEYKTLWGERKMMNNPMDDLYMDMITEQMCYEVQLDCRAKVDVLMRLELELLEAALAYDKGKAKKPKAKAKAKKDKCKKKKDKKDLTAKRNVEDLFQELVDAGVIRTYPETHLEDFRGDMSYSNWEKRLEEYDPPAALGDVRQVVALTCVLPLGVQTMTRPKSVLMIGPKNCGKHLLANAVLTETRSVLFDLSAPVLAGKYRETKMLVHLVNKMSRLLQPSVIFFDGAEKPFYKKVPKQEKDLEPKKLGGHLYKQIVKGITPEDRVLVLGISAQPWAAKAQGIKKAFERVIQVILIPRADYGSVHLYWRELLMPYHGVDRNLDVSCLTRLSVNYPLCQLKEIVQRVMTPRRIIQLSYKPLRQLELYDLLISPRYGPVTDKEHKKFVKFYKKTTLGRRKAKYMEAVERKREQEAKAAAKAAEKTAKKK